MAIEGAQPFKWTFQAAGDLSGNQYRFVKLDTNGRVTPCTALTDKPVGVQQNKPAAIGRACEVVIIGITKMVAGAVLAYGNRIGTDTTSRAIAVADTNAAPDGTTAYSVGVILKVNTATNGIVTAIVDCAVARHAA